MSYNPAFICDESPPGCAPGDSHGQSNGGIKLTSFKPLAGLLDDAKLVDQQRQQSNDCQDHRQRKQAQQKVAAKQKNSGNFLLSSSSSLSLIDNPTLSSLTTSTATTATNTISQSSYSSDSSSIVSSGLCAAVECRDMRYCVGRGKNQKTILHDINVTVPEGSIYGLLGPSGCGKTTMLRCVVGRIKPKSGYVRVFGYAPNESGSQIPGPAIGYMPQVSIDF